MAIYHGSVRRPASLERSDAPTWRTPDPVARRTAGPAGDASTGNRPAAAEIPVEAGAAAAPDDRRPRTVGKRKRAKQPRAAEARSGAPASTEPPSAVANAAGIAGHGGHAGLPDGVGDSVERLLHLPRGELAKLLAEADGSANKVWLALIYRLSALESQVNELAGALRAAASPVMPAPAVAAGRGADGRADVLEQVFRKNLTLRKGLGE